jgi:cell division septal protein FtsQ
VAALAFGIEKGRRWLLADGRFPVTEIRVSGNELLYEGEVLATAGVERGVNILTVRAGEVEGRLLASGWIREARVRRRPPGRVLVEIEERRPWLLRPGEPAAFIDREGRAFPAMGKEETLDLPILADRSGSPRAVVARLADAFPPGDPWFAENVLEVAVDARGSVVLVERTHGARIRLGDSGFVERAARIRSVLEEWAKTGEAYEEVDLRYEGQAIARRPIPQPVADEEGSSKDMKGEGRKKSV